MELDFPKGFLWGAATAAHQVEGNNTNSDWWAWEKACPEVEESGIACDHYHLYEKDFDLAKKLGHNAHRLSLEWARLEPKSGVWNEDEVGHYRQVLCSLKDAGMAAMVTLHHFSNPKWLADAGGWLNPQAVRRFKRYARFAAERFGDLVDYWLTINEPGIYTLHGYHNAIWPPQQTKTYQAWRVYFNLAQAHKQAYLAIHQVIPQARVGMTKSMAAWHSGRPKMILGPISQLFSLVANQSFYWLTKGHHDFLGFNYYLLKVFRIGFPKLRFNPEESGEILTGQRSDLGWMVYPMGIYEVLKSLKKYQLPIFITENGIADEKDTRRARFIIDHLEWVLEAIKEGADVRGYFHWTLMDNFEWHLGRKPRFGLMETDYQTLGRRVRDSAWVYAQIARANSLEPVLHDSRPRRV